MQPEPSLQLSKAPADLATLPPDPIDVLLRGLADPVIRKEMTKQFNFFCLIYLPHYFELEPADFFDELLAALENNDIDALLVIGFRGSAKSTRRRSQAGRPWSVFLDRSQQL